MNLTSRYSKLPVVLLLGASALFVLLFAGGPPKAQAAEVKCPTFRVLHNDRIGKLKLPKGTYGMTVLNGNKLTCPKASRLFAEFLQDWDGKLRKPWVVNVKQSSFTAGRGSDKGFRVKRGGGGGGGGGGGHTPRSCPGYFTVVHNDSIGSFKVPRGRYRITLVGPRKINCATAVRRFQEFLYDFDGVLPKPWYLHRNTATFTRGRTAKVGFNINKAYGPSPNPNKNKKATRCPGTFRVLHNDRIGKLKLPKGPYYIKSGNGLSCASASNYFRQFLNRPDGKLPRPWRLNVGKARFQQGKGGPYFRVQQA